MTKARRVPDYLGHILKAIERIERYTDYMDELVFLGNELVQDAVIRNIEIIGEASNNIQRVDAAIARARIAREGGQRRQEAGKRLAGTGRRNEERGLAGIGQREQLELVRARRPAMGGEPVPELRGQRLDSFVHGGDNGAAS